MATQSNAKSVVRVASPAPLVEAVPAYQRNVTREPHALSRVPVLAREAAVLQLSNDMGETAMQSVVTQWNGVLRNSFPGTGYFAEHPHQAVNGNKRVFVLFADDTFYKAYLTGEGAKNVEAVEASVPAFSGYTEADVGEEIVATLPVYS